MGGVALKRSLSRKWFPVVFLLSTLFVSPATAVQVLTISGTGASLSGVRLLSNTFMKDNPGIRIEVLPILGTDGSINAVLAGKLDIGVGCRPLKAAERNAGISGFPYARAPFVFCVHSDVKLKGITLRDAIDIYAGKKKNWNDGSRIRLIMRQEGETDLAVLRGISKEMADAVDSAMRRQGMICATNDHDCAEAIEHTPGAFGALTLTMVTFEKRTIRVLPLDGVYPNNKAVIDGSYPHFKEFILFTGKESPQAARHFIDFARSREGAAILSRAGFIPVR